MSAQLPLNCRLGILERQGTPPNPMHFQLHHPVPQHVDASHLRIMGHLTGQQFRCAGSKSPPARTRSESPRQTCDLLRRQGSHGFVTFAPINVIAHIRQFFLCGNCYYDYSQPVEVIEIDARKNGVPKVRRQARGFYCSLPLGPHGRSRPQKGICTRTPRQTPVFARWKAVCLSRYMHFSKPSLAGTPGRLDSKLRNS